MIFFWLADCARRPAGMTGSRSTRLSYYIDQHHHHHPLSLLILLIVVMCVYTRDAAQLSRSNSAAGRPPHHPDHPEMDRMTWKDIRTLVAEKEKKGENRYIVLCDLPGQPSSIPPPLGPLWIALDLRDITTHPVLYTTMAFWGLLDIVETDDRVYESVECPLLCWTTLWHIYIYSF